MKRIFKEMSAFFICMILCIMIMSEARLTTAQTISEENNTAVIVVTRTIQHEVKDDFGNTILTSNYEYPKLVQSASTKYKNIKKVNHKIEAFVKDLYDKSLKSGEESAKEFSEFLNTNGQVSSLFPFQVNLNYNLTFNKNGYVSMTIQDFQWLGGAHPSTYQYGLTYDLNRGKIVKATDFLSMEEIEIKKYIADEMQIKFKENSDYYFEDEVKKLENLSFDYNYYLTDEGLIFYFNNYEVAPYVTGIVTVELNYKEHDRLFKDLSIFQ